MNYPCGIIKDLLPLYIDGIANEDSRTAVEEHLRNCERCRETYEAMTAPESFNGEESIIQEDINMADSLKKVKKRLNKKIRNIILRCAVLALALILSFGILFNMPLKNIAAEDISVDVLAYPMAEIASIGHRDEDSVSISISENDNSESYSLNIPAMPKANIVVSESLVERNGYVSVISWSCPYLIKGIEYKEGPDEDTIYVEAVRTTLLNNQAAGNVQTTLDLEFKKVERVVFVENGAEIVLWSK